jgi:hypothetical protein
MNRKILLIVMAFSYLFTSCDPAIAVAISNKTTQDKHIQGVWPAGTPMVRYSGDKHGDSLRAFDLNIADYYNSIKMIPLESIDTVTGRYSFVLKPGYQAIVESRFLAVYPTFGQVFIIDQSDTVQLVHRGKGFRKRPKIWLGGTWKHEIK